MRRDASVALRCASRGPRRRSAEAGKRPQRQRGPVEGIPTSLLCDADSALASCVTRATPVESCRSVNGERARTRDLRQNQCVMPRKAKREELRAAHDAADREASAYARTVFDGVQPAMQPEEEPAAVRALSLVRDPAPEAANPPSPADSVTAPTQVTALPASGIFVPFMICVCVLMAGTLLTRRRKRRPWSRR
jgi:hypothetical protein